MNFLRKFIGSSPTDEIASIAKGKLFLTRLPNSPKGSLECLYNDAFICIKQTTRAYYYQLSVCKVYQEGEITDSHEHDFGDSDDEDDSGANSDQLTNSITNKSKDEWSFIIVNDLSFRFIEKKDGTKAINWVDINGDFGDKFEFVIDDEVKNNEVAQFKLALFKCLYEQKYQKLSNGVGIEDLWEFEQDDDESRSDGTNDLLTIDDVRNDLLSYNKAQMDKEKNPRIKADEDDEDDEDEDEDDEDDAEDDAEDDSEEDKDDKKSVKPFTFIEGTTSDSKEDLVFSTDVNLFLYENQTFKFKGPVTAKLLNVDKWKYTLKITNGDSIKFEAFIDGNMNPYFDIINESFVFNYFKPHDQDPLVLLSFSWLLKFPSLTSISNFKQTYVKLYWQSINKKNFGDQNKPEQSYLADSLSAMKIDDSEDEFLSAEEEHDDESSEESEEESSEDEEESRAIKGDYDEVESSPGRSLTDYNSLLSVGYANDRSYVVRGNNLGVFKADGKDVQFETAISNLADKLGKKVNPTKLMLQNRDEHMIIKTDADDRLFRMDLNTGKIVEDWHLKNQEGVRNFNPNKKYDQLTGEITFSGISSNSMFHLDPRLSDVIVKDGSKEYKTKNNGFNHIVTTDSGNIAVGSDNGSIRLFNGIGGNAKTLLPTLGDEINSLDISKDGRWLLATCNDYLLLIDNKIGKGQKNAGELGFNKPFNADSKPVPRRLKLKPEHHNEILNSLGAKSLNFSHAYFDTKLIKHETSIITSTDKFLILFNLKNVLSNKEPKYTVKKFGDKIINNEFKFDSNDIIMTSRDDVMTSNKQRFRQFENVKI